MSKAEELAKCLDLYDDDQTATHAAAHLRALEANRQMLVHALENCRSVMGANGLGSVYSAQLADTALEQAKELT